MGLSWMGVTMMMMMNVVYFNEIILRISFMDERVGI